MRPVVGLHASAQARWFTFASLSLLYFVGCAGTFSSLGVVLPSMVRELHWNWTEAGLGYTFLGLSCGLVSLAPAVMIRRIGVSATVLAGAALLLAGFAMLACTHAVWVYLAATLIIGVGFTLTSTVPGTHVLTGLFARQSTMVGAYFTIGGLGGVAGPLLYVFIAGHSGQWRQYWWCLVGLVAAIGVFAAATTSGRPDVSDTAAVPTPAELLDGLNDWTVRRALFAPQFYVIVGAYTMYLLINTTAHGFAVEHLTERGVSAASAAGMLSLEALIGAVVAVIGGVIGEKISAKILLLVALASLTVGMMALALAHGLGPMLVYALGVGIGYGLSFLASAMLMLKYFGKRANLELYSIMCLISTAAALGPAVGGWARDTLGSFTGVFELCAGATLAMLVITAFMRPPALRA